MYKKNSEITVFNRRMFLKGAGSFAIALPVLPSLLLNDAYAQSVSTIPYLISMFTQHGGVSDENFLPQNVPAGIIKQQLIGGVANWNLKYFQFSDFVDGTNNPSISNVLGRELNPYLNQINIIKGINHTWNYHNNGILGNYHHKKAGGDFGTNKNHKYDSIDHLLVHNSKFMGDFVPQEKIIGISHGDGRHIPSSYFNSQGELVAYASSGSRPHYLFQKLFPLYNPNNSDGNINIPQSILDKKSIIDKVLGSYRNITSGSYGVGKRISAEDKLVFEEHIEQLREIEVKINRTISSVNDLSCSSFSTGYNDLSGIGAGSEHTYSEAIDGPICDVVTDIITVAIKCGLTKFASISLNYCNEHKISGGYHPDMAHQHTDPVIQAELTKGYQRMCKHYFSALVRKLDAIKVGDGSLLDQGLVYWGQEFGDRTHIGVGKNIITAGGSNGAFNTGHFIDYRHPTSFLMSENNVAAYDNDPIRFAAWADKPLGLSYNRWLASVLQGFGLSPADFEKYGNKGYGHPEIDAKSYGGSSGGAPTLKELAVDNSVKLPFWVKA